ncbi:DUF4907 domain-containing protein [Muricauda sp. CAU 1633]|uniref:DUF4907 domain-containing protein n=1 Tax=Allomuricauda sp. CAU 1633 TaxID=2816036 RepID=UPI001A8E2A98|nr:DUF4907 domain-containing protein [Muricauda sp. CAU 1633]MBO0320729.1 DUF4907 domain-containing protein [Muricauda sp. CAU 1633]
MALAYYGFVEMFTEPVKEDSKIHAEVILAGEGYGYQIYHGERVLIKQEFIPAVHGTKPFTSPTDARRVAKLVMEKITKRVSPEITQSEIEALDVVILED